MLSKGPYCLLGILLFAYSLVSATPQSIVKRVLLNQSGNAGKMSDTTLKTPEGEPVSVIRISKRKDTPSVIASALDCTPAVNFVKGHQYRVQFFAKSSIPFSLATGVKQQSRPWSFVGSSSKGNFEMTNKWQNCVMFFKASRNWNAKDVRIGIYLGLLPARGQLWLGPIKIEELSNYQTLDMKKCANFGFTDNIAGDRKGGWTDQGANNDFSNFPIKNKWFAQIPFSIIDPAQNNGRAILSFDCDYVKTELKKAELNVPSNAKNCKYLYLLNAIAWTPKKNTVIGKIHYISESGITKTENVIAGKHVADWWMPRHGLKEASVVLEMQNGSNKVGAYITGFNLPPGTREITLETTGVSAWLVIAATLADFKPVKEIQKVLTMTAGTSWKPIDTDDLFISPGTALDFSEKPEPCGTHGRIIINKRGKLAFANSPDKALHLQGFVELPRGLLWWPNFLKKEQLDEYAAAVARQGYKLIRLHMVEEMLIFRLKGMPSEGKLCDKPEDIPFVPENVDYFNYLIHCLKKHGIYVVLDVFGSFRGYTGTAYKSKSKLFSPGKIRQKMYYDEKYRSHWKAGVTRLLTMKNPYTGMTLAEDPVVAFIHLNNEQCFTWAPEHAKGLTPFWKEWARKHNLTNVPPLSNKASKGRDKIADYINRFISEREIILNNWYEKTVRDLGYTGLLNNWNNSSPIMRIPPRAMLQVVSQNIYFNYPKGYLSPGAIISQASTIPSTWDFSGMVRFLDRPFGPTEYAAPAFWARYRHEQGIRFGSYSTLQDWDFLCLHASAVVPKAKVGICPFGCGYDPIIRAAEVFTHFAYAKGYVKRSPNAVAYPVNDKIIFSGNARNGFDLVFGKLFFLCKTGLLYDGVNNPSAAKNVKFDMAVEPVGGSILTDHGMFETIKAGTTKVASQNTIRNVVKEMRRKGILGPGNITDLRSGILQSDTGEITAWTKSETMTVITPKLEAIAIKKNKPVTLNQVKIKTCSVPASVSVISLDETKKINDSSHLLVIFSTDSLNSNMSFTSEHKNKLIDKGGMPILVQTGTLALDVKNSTLKNPVVYALRLNGTRVDQIPAKRQGNKFSFTVNTAKLKAGPTPFFEIAEK